ncbi:CRISPR-associated protein Cas4 [Alicyclobacillus cycloheptanicus]|uniref:CRISPR-associated exonuclease Cas4 n=1 Tax=Alicyclobacillus cycloheptanicus TaxID=1457 RepID=A0ABT9XLW6_9BACL|nr:CRISPR-associated protein Cas4 [Alicyclobacillus cycloheptanicus]MDQ0191306.1 CRISPR-associated exonuclease Cas4 [Alicyclobacillus cycloheptanicus]WDM02423.1 CRISPR-associated protein Cas4 [Alicyclobacillus cycloheptanicus]
MADTVPDEVHVTGTLVWYYHVCPREAWLMSRQLTPDEEDDNIRIGRLIHEESYVRFAREVTTAAGKMDRLVRRDGQWVVYEVKKSSRHEVSARMQLLYYLLQLHEDGVEAVGELHFPEERRVVRVTLGPSEMCEIQNTVKEIQTLMSQPLPPPPKRIPVCRQCAYAEFCWA